MEILAIGKPAINVYIPLQEFPQEGDIFTIKRPIESAGNVSMTAACMLGKWGEKVHFTGVVGSDNVAEKVKNVLSENNVDIKNIESNYQNATASNYIILNAKTGMQSKIICQNPEVQLTKFRYDFNPDYAIVDGTDFAGVHALINNNSNCKIIYYARVATRDDITISKRANYVICTQAFAEGMSKVKCDDNIEEYVNLYQKMVDLGGHSNFIILLNNHKILYSINSQVKMLPEMKINVSDYSSLDSIFVGAFTYALIHDLNMDDAIKFSNTASALSLSKVGEVNAIPELNDIMENSGLKGKLMMQEQNPSTAVAPENPSPLNPNYKALENEATNQNVTNNNIETQNMNANNTNIAFNQQPTLGSSNEVVNQQQVATPNVPNQNNAFIPSNNQNMVNQQVANSGNPLLNTNNPITEQVPNAGNVTPPPALTPTPTEQQPAETNIFDEILNG